MLPNFIIVGAMKSGTTSLYHYLKVHPDICMSSIKESDFFIAEKNYSKGIGWYKSLFSCGDEKIIGEASPNYTKRHLFGGVPKRIHSLLPKVKIIFLVREPIKRIFSHYIHNDSRGREWKSFSRAIQGKNNHYLLTSKYFYQLQVYREYYSDEYIKIIKSERLREEREKTLKEIFGFIGTDTNYKSKEFKNQYNTVKSKRKRRSLYDRYIRKLDFLNLKPCLPAFLTKAKPFELPNIGPEEKKVIAAEVMEDFKKLQEITDENFSDWMIANVN
jgi:hypothetical protein